LLVAAHLALMLVVPCIVVGRFASLVAIQFVLLVATCFALL